MRGVSIIMFKNEDVGVTKIIMSSSSHVSPKLPPKIASQLLILVHGKYDGRLLGKKKHSGKVLQARKNSSP